MQALVLSSAPAFNPLSMHPAVICCVYVSADSFLSVHTHPLMEAHELLRIVGLKMDRADEDMVLAVVSNTGGTHTHTHSQTLGLTPPSLIHTVRDTNKRVINGSLNTFRTSFIQYFEPPLFYHFSARCSSALNGISTSRVMQSTSVPGSESLFYPRAVNYYHNVSVLILSRIYLSLQSGECYSPVTVCIQSP